MSHPIFWESKWFFYPIGNTSPVCLTEYLPPEQDASILLLGCGDTRNVLYTVYASGHDGRPDRKLDFTCCDWEPAVLARNVILYTLLYDHNIEIIHAQLWNIFYHFMVDDASLSLLTSHCSKLIELSKDIETWNASSYATVFRFCNRYTLAEIRRLWSSYVAMSEWPRARRKAFQRDFRDSMREIAGRFRNVATAQRNAGPFGPYAGTDVADLHDQFWKNGTLVVQPDATNINPTFAFASHMEGFVAHYGTCPITAFPLAPAYLELNKKPSASKDDLIRTVHTQFRTWCEAFCTSVKEKNNIVIRLVVGDVLTTCRSLRAVSISPNSEISAQLPVKAWNAARLVFDGGDYSCEQSSFTAPLSFDIIDTSNLSDHIGMLNILLAIVPLLKRTPFSTVNTETLLAMGKNPTRSFANRLCGDIATISALLGLLPISFVSGFTPHSNVHELMNQGLLLEQTELEARQFHERLVWKVTSSGPERIAAESTQLARLLFSVYLQMFSYEDTMSMFRNLGDVTDFWDRSSVHYSRESFALFIHYLKDRIEADWPRVVEALLFMVSSDRQLMMGLNHYQELLCHLHLLGIYSEDIFNRQTPALLKNRRMGRLCGWREIPPTVCIVLQIPRSKLEPLDDPTMPKTPVLNAEIVSMSANFHNAFSSLYVAFGTVTIDDKGEDSQVSLIEDPRGKLGQSSLVVAFYVPTWLLAISPEQTLVTLAVKSTPMHSSFASKLGFAMRLHSAPLMDTESVFVVRSLPTLGPTSHGAGAINRAASGSRSHIPPATIMTTQAQFDDSGHVLRTLTARMVVEGGTKLELAKPSTQVTLSQGGSCEIDVHIGINIVEQLKYPYPVDGDNTKLRIARKSGWIEVVAPLCNAAALRPDQFFVANVAGTRAPWNIHRINLDRLPTVEVTSSKKDYSWAGIHVTLMLSDKERNLAMAKDHRNMPALVHLKQSIVSIFHRIIKPASEKGSRVFGLHKMSGGGVGTVIFIENLRLDLASHTIVADGYVLPLDDTFVSQFINKLGVLEQAEGITHLACPDSELTEWARLIPAFVERCRDWSHKTNCAYVRKGVVPLGTQFGEVPICDCGRDRVSSSFKQRKNWAPFAPYVTRIAISPLFAVSYLDAVGRDIASQVKGKKQTTQATMQKPATEGLARCACCEVAIPEDARVMRCSRCKQTIYCGSTCQAKDWPKHKKVCVKV